MPRILNFASAPLCLGSANAGSSRANIPYTSQKNFCITPGVARPVGMGERRELHGLDAAYAPELSGEYRREVDEFVEREHVRELAEHQQVHLRGVGELPGLDLFTGRKFLDLVSRQMALDYLRENWYHSARRCLELFFHCTVYDTWERRPKATTFLLTSRHRYCMAVKILIIKIAQSHFSS